MAGPTPVITPWSVVTLSGANACETLAPPAMAAPLIDIANISSAFRAISRNPRGGHGKRFRMPISTAYENDSTYNV